MVGNQAVADIVEEVWTMVKDDTLTAERLQNLAESGIKFGDVNVEEMFKTKYGHDADEKMMFEHGFEDLIPHSTNHEPVQELKHYLYNAACQQNLRIMKDAVKKLFDLP